MAVDKQRKLAPESVFTPRAPVTREMFARRDEGKLQQRFEDALREPGSQIMLYGDTGVGKTSLVLHVANEMGLSVARIECFSGKSFHDLLSDAFAAIAEIRNSASRSPPHNRAAVKFLAESAWVCSRFSKADCEARQAPRKRASSKRCRGR